MPFSPSPSWKISVFNVRLLLVKALPILALIATTFMSYKTLCFLTDCPFPILVVTSESMSPAFHRGDIIFISNRSEFIDVGDVPVVWFPGKALPMVHRAIQVHFEEAQPENEGTLSTERFEGMIGAVERAGRVAGTMLKQMILTKGDNNDVDDRGLYPPGKSYVEREEVVGAVRGYVPVLGWASMSRNIK